MKRFPEPVHLVPQLPQDSIRHNDLPHPVPRPARFVHPESNCACSPSCLRHASRFPTGISFCVPSGVWKSEGIAGESVSNSSFLHTKTSLLIRLLITEMRSLGRWRGCADVRDN
jgi:hypothetical protein